MCVFCFQEKQKQIMANYDGGGHTCLLEEHPPIRGRVSCVSLSVLFVGLSFIYTHKGLLWFCCSQLSKLVSNGHELSRQAGALCDGYRRPLKGHPSGSGREANQLLTSTRAGGRCSLGSSPATLGPSMKSCSSCVYMSRATNRNACSPTSFSRSKAKRRLGEKHGTGGVRVCVITASFSPHPQTSRPKRCFDCCFSQGNANKVRKKHFAPSSHTEEEDKGLAPDAQQLYPARSSGQLPGYLPPFLFLQQPFKVG